MKEPIIYTSEYLRKTAKTQKVAEAISSALKHLA